MFKSKELMFPRDKCYFMDTSWIFFQNYFLSTSFWWGRGSFLLIVFLCFCVLNGEIRFKRKISCLYLFVLKQHTCDLCLWFHFIKKPNSINDEY